MGRPILALSEQQSADLTNQLGHIIALHIGSPAIHRGFVRDFLSTVYFVTGKVFGPQFYRRLLKQYAPQRRPSTTTIESELERFRNELRDNAKKHSLEESSDVPAASHNHKVHKASPATNALDPADRRLLQQVLDRLDSINALLQSKELQRKEAPILPVPRNCEMPFLTQFYQERLLAVETELSKVRTENQGLLDNAMKRPRQPSNTMNFRCNKIRT